MITHFWTDEYKVLDIIEGYGYRYVPDSPISRWYRTDAPLPLPGLYRYGTHLSACGKDELEKIEYGKFVKDWRGWNEQKRV